MYVIIRKVIRKYRLYYRHLHFELSSILREFNTIFGLQMVMQLILLHVSGVHLVLRFYHIITTERTYSFAIHFSSMALYALRCIVDIITLNHICEEVCMKVKFADILEKLCEINFFIYEDACGY